MGDSHPTARATRDAILRGTTSAEAVCEAALARIAAADPDLHAFHLVDAERALTRARVLDQQAGPPGPLHGVPVALKDNIAVAGMRTTAGSKILADYVPAL